MGLTRRRFIGSSLGAVLVAPLLVDASEPVGD